MRTSIGTDLGVRGVMLLRSADTVQVLMITEQSPCHQHVSGIHRATDRIPGPTADMLREDTVSCVQMLEVNSNDSKCSNQFGISTENETRHWLAI